VTSWKGLFYYRSGSNIWLTGCVESSDRVDYVPALCTHRPSLKPIEWSDEVFGLLPVHGQPCAVREEVD